MTRSETGRPERRRRAYARGPESAERNRAWSRARGRALGRLVRENEDRFRVLLREELERELAS